MIRRIEIVIEFTDEAWADELRGEPGYTPTEAEVLEYYVEYAQGANFADGVTYSGRIEGQVGE